MSLSVLIAAPAKAQDVPPPLDRPEWIDVQSGVATALYIASPLTLGAGAALCYFGIGEYLWQSEEEGGDSTLGHVMAYTGLIGGVAGWLLFIPAIVLDVSSGQRRRALEAEDGAVFLDLGPGGVSVRGTF